MTPLAMDERNSPAGESYQRMIEASAAGRVGTPDEIGATAAFLMGRRRVHHRCRRVNRRWVIAAIATGRYHLNLGV
jgi:NAD(P)-dependent dehydrogenase (short-subunit alcohol dehydrogenase family)